MQIEYLGLNPYPRIGGSAYRITSQSGKTSILLDFGMDFKAHHEYFGPFLEPRGGAELQDLFSLKLLPPLPGLYRKELLEVPFEPDETVACGKDAPLFRVGLQSYDEFLSVNGRPFVDAIFLSHAHMDHSGFLPHVDNRIPMYCTEQTYALLRADEDAGKTDDMTCINEKHLKKLGSKSPCNGTYHQYSVAQEKKPQIPRNFRMLPGSSSEPVTLGDFSIFHFPVDHSIPGCTSFLIKDKDGMTLWYSGDLRFTGLYPHVTQSAIDAISKIGVDIIMLEGTRAKSELDQEFGINESKSPTEKGLENELAGVFASSNGFVGILSSRKHIDRWLIVAQAAESSRRFLLLDGLTLFVIQSLAQLEKSIKQENESASKLWQMYVDHKINVFVPRIASCGYRCYDYSQSKLAAGLSVRWENTPDLTHLQKGVLAGEIAAHPDHYVLQLDYYHLTQLLDIAPKGGIFIYGGYNAYDLDEMAEKARIENYLKVFGIKSLVMHVSGHALGDDLRGIIRHLKPKYVIPIHLGNESYQDEFRGIGGSKVVSIFHGKSINFQNKNGTIDFH